MKKIPIFCLALVLLASAGCYKTITEMENNATEVVLSYPAAEQFNAASSGLNFWKDQLISPDLGKVTDTLEFSLNIPHALDKDITVNLGVDKHAVATYNKDTIYGGIYTILPDSTYQLVSTKVVIPSGVTDTVLEIALKPLGIDISETGYILPVSIVSADGVAVSSMHTAYIHIEKDPFPPFSRADWEAVAWDSQEEVGEGPDNGRVRNVFDNNTGTYWHSQWKGGQPPLPHWFIINMHTVHTLHGFKILDRQGVSSPGRPKNVKFEVSTDNVTWTNVGEFTLEDQNGSWQKMPFDNPVSQVKYFRFTVNSTYGDTYYTNMAEFQVY
ncbi:MAG TPA: discoidin domain-containing protein [Chitinophagaceae bacterium]|nr:discoidin domain-containing protein [Chitinophagaceae bacterium]